MSEHVSIFEMSPRDGLQNEATAIPTAAKVHLVNHISDCGFADIEVTSFVNPARVPQLADAAEMMDGIARSDGVRYWALTPNMKGYERAKAAHADGVAVFASASEGFSQANLNCSIAESLARFVPVTTAAHEDGIPLRGYVSCVTDCPFDGSTSPADVARVVRALADLGCAQISLGDTIGHGTPQTVAAMLEAVLSEVSADQLAGHYHDTKGHALDNIAVSLDLGLRTFDASLGGLGGCPFAPGASGNVSTLAAVEMIEGTGYTTGLDGDMLSKADAFARSLVRGKT